MSERRQKKRQKKSPKDRSGFTGTTFALMECPKCGKRRMQRPLGHKVTLAKCLSPDKQSERYIDICHVCQYHYYIEDKKYTETKVNVAKTALQKGESIPDGVSLEDAL